MRAVGLARGGVGGRVSATLRVNRYVQLPTRTYAVCANSAGTHERKRAGTHERTRIGKQSNAGIPHPKAKLQLILDKRLRIMLVCNCRQNDTE